MKLLVILEQHFYIDGERVYVDVQCDRTFWSRYLNVFQEILVCARVSPLSKDQSTEKLLRSDREGVSFIALPEFRGAMGAFKNQASVRKVIRNAIAQCDRVTMRIPSPISIIAYSEIVRSKTPFAVDMMMNPWTAYSRESMCHPLQPVIQMFSTLATKRICSRANGVSYVTERILQQQYPCRAIRKGETSRYFTAYYSTIHLVDAQFSMMDWENDFPNPLVLVHTGKMSDYRKGHDIFIDVVKRLNDRGIPTKGIMIGDGIMREKLESYVREINLQEKIEFAGWIAGFDSVQKILQKAHIFVYPTKSEGLPRAVIEAMASGLICVASAVDGIPELLPETATCSEISAASFADRVEYIVKNWNEATEMRMKNFAKAKEYRADILSERRRSFYEKLRDVKR